MYVVAVVLAATLTGCPSTTPTLVTVLPLFIPSTLATPVTLTGTNFQAGATATFTRADGVTVIGTVATTYVNSTTLTCASPTLAGLTSNEQVRVTVTSGGKVSNHFNVTYTPPPSVTSVLPTQVPASISTQVTLTGINFSAGAEVRFRRPDLSLIGTGSSVSVSPGTITCNTPTDTITADMAVRVEVVNLDDQVSAKVVKAYGTVTYLAPPTITDINPGGAAHPEIPASTGVAAPGVTITGTNFETGMTVTYALPGGDVDATTVNIVSATQITCNAPAIPGLTTDTAITVTVTAPDPPDGQSASYVVTYAAPPTIAGITPNELPATISFPFAITGTNFKTGATVMFALPVLGSTSALSIVVDPVSGASITAMSPVETTTLAAPTAVVVTVANPDGQSDTVSCTYWPRPVVTAPPGNPTPTDQLTSTIAMSIDIAGDLFRAGSAVTFRDSTVTGIQDIDATVSGTGANGGGSTLTCLTPIISDPSPPNPRGPRLLTDDVGSIIVVGPQGQTSVNAPAVTYVAPPIVYQGTISADFNGVLTGSPAAHIPATISTAFNVGSVANPGANFDTTGTVDVVFSALTGSGGTVDHVIGTVTVAPTSAGAVSGNTPVDNTIVDPTYVLVQVRNPDGQMTVPGLEIIYDPPPVVDSVINNATNASEVGATTTAAPRAVTINGKNFDSVGGVTVEFNLPSSGWTTATTGAVTATTIACTAPALPSAAASLPDSITTDTLLDVRVTNNDGQATGGTQNPHGDINYQPEPNPSGITSDVSVTGFGYVIPATIATDFALSGTNFEIDATALTVLGQPTVTFTPTTPAAANATGVNVTSDTALDGTSPTFATLANHEQATVTMTDAYLQPSIGTPPQIWITAPPVITTFNVTLINPGNPTGVVEEDIFGSTQASAFQIIGENFIQGADVSFYQVCGPTTEFASSPVASSAVADGLPGGPFTATTLDGTTPTETITVTLTNASVIVNNPDGQSSAEHCSIKVVAPPEIYAVTQVNGDPAWFVANGELRSRWDTGPTSLATPVTMHLHGLNLDSVAPVSGNGSTWLTLSDGAHAKDGVQGASPAGDDEARIIDNTGVEFEFMDDATSNQMADLLGFIDVVSLTDYTGQTTSAGIDNAMITVLGPINAGEGDAVGLATGEFTGDAYEDLVVVKSRSAGHPSGGLLQLAVYSGLATGGYDLLTPWQVGYAPSVSTGAVCQGSANVVVCDWDNDGYDDVIVGVPGADIVSGATAAGGDGGHVYIFYGEASGLLGNTAAADINAASAIGAVGNECFGASLAVGDHNGDGFLDLVVGAPGEINSSLNMGVAYLYTGNGSRLVDNHIPSGQREITGSPSTTDAPDFFGASVAMGDWDGDGDDEIFIGAPGYNGGATLSVTDSGVVVAFFGDSNMDATVDWTSATGAAGDAAGYSVVSSDLDSDSIADLIIGSPQFGVAWTPAGLPGTIDVYLGRTAGTSHPFIADATFSAGVAEDTLGIGSGLKPIAGTGELLVGMPHLIAGNLPGQAALLEYNATTPGFDTVEGYPKPVGGGFSLTGEDFGTYVEYIELASGGLEVFVAMPNAEGGANDGFVVYYPADGPTSYVSTDGEAVIPDNGATYSRIDVPDSFTVTDVNVRVHISHTWDSDLDVYLAYTPVGSAVPTVTVELFSDVGAAGNDFYGTTLDDEGSAAITAGSAPFTGCFTPENALSAFDGVDAEGTWTLVVEDDSSGDTGTLHEWSLTFNTADNTP
ncbi:MAG: IPT/TIG domain-containing protein [Candidatus Hydrogenedentes bacterium]|nr:IPT/TIG domain-containing protein [Candidatus Hydrogenedentota bacterium]